MKRIILSAVVAAAIFGGYTANQTSSEVAMSDLQVENVEALADPPEGEGNPKNYLTGPRPHVEVQITYTSYSDGATYSSADYKRKGGSAGVGNGNIGASVGGGSGSHSGYSSGSHVVYTKTVTTYACLCDCENDNYCTDYIPN